MVSESLSLSLTSLSLAFVTQESTNQLLKRTLFRTGQGDAVT